MIDNRTRIDNAQELADALLVARNELVTLRSINANLLGALVSLKKAVTEELYWLDGSKPEGRYPLRDALNDARAAIARAKARP